MCGIAGIIGEANEGLIRRMTDLIGHRGPDDSGIRVFPNSGQPVSLGHRRLSIPEIVMSRQQAVPADREPDRPVDGTPDAEPQFQVVR